jgi:SH3-like domain-containing protein
MSNTFENSITVTKTGANTASGAASAGGTIPTCSSGELPRYIRVTASNAAYFRIGPGAQTAVNTDLMVQPGDAVTMAVCNLTNYACLQVSVAGVVVVTPLENM